MGARFLYPRLLFQPPPFSGRVAGVDPESRFVEMPHADGSRTVGLYYPASSGARTVVVFHGNGETIFHNEAHAAELKRRGLGVLLVEYRGYGATPGPSPSEAMLYDDGEAAIAYLAREKVSPDRIALWGWSLGSSVAAEMAHRGHGARLLLLSPFTSIVAMGRRFAPFLPMSLIMAHRLDTLSKAPSIRQPTLVIHGDADELIPFAMGEAVARAIPKAELLRVEGGHHADLLYAGSGGRPDAQALFDRIARHLGE
jgi:fermentation-respiration switch protein FrsA (DUF1100 family)